MPGPEFFDDMIEQDAAERRRIALQEAEVRNKADAEAAAIRKQADTERTIRNNRMFLLRDYEVAGVRPPFTLADGTPTASLALLQKLGWRIESMGGENVLVDPTPRRA